ncbi:hypothetical protein CMI41_04305 [Candidatus Pacearchaeota archaeon]|nr:hypothetical protein [Candidatus Pacearchaeota archaeon]|tara:strand:- start:2864 stop:3307 length:444 start_codon:yes stop_codon:yes gene_type:complete
MTDLIHGKDDYRIRNPNKEHENFYPCMYVRDEIIRDAGEWHLFAGIWSKGCLLRVRVPVEGFKDLGRDILESERLVAKVVTFTKSERSGNGEELVNTFIEEAYNLIRNSGSRTSTIREDAENLAGIYGIQDEKARLRIIIDHAKHTD